jgi:hypothetical protein
MAAPELEDDAQQAVGGRARQRLVDAQRRQPFQDQAGIRCAVKGDGGTIKSNGGGVSALSHN